MSDWTHELELLFLEIYQGHPIIWDPKERDHKDRYKVYDAWKTMSEALDMPVKELKSKKDSLMTTFRMHKRKIRSSQSSGAGSDDIYTPIWFAFNFMDSFLGDIVDCNNNKTKNTITTTHEPNYEDESQDSQQQSLDTNPASNDSSAAQPNSSQTIRRRKNPPELKEAGQTLNKTLNTLNDVLQKEQNKNTSTQNTSQEKEDECDLYGKIFAKKLKKIPEHERISFIYEVDGMFIRRFSRNAPSFTNRMSRPSSTCTSYSESIPQQGKHTPEYRVEERLICTPSFSYFATSPPQHHQPTQEILQERPPSTSGLPYIITSPQQHQLSQQHNMVEERPPSTAGFPYITISPQQHQPPKQYMEQERPPPSVEHIASSPQQNNAKKPILIRIPKQSPAGSSVVNSQKSISILSDITVTPPSDDSSQHYIVKAFKNA